MNDHLSEEEWRPVARYGGKYEVSSLGRVRVTATAQVRSQHLNRGYPTVSWYFEGKRGTVRVHQLVAEAFHGPRPDGMEVRHLDGVRTNNVPSNLAYGTHLENIQDTVRHGTARNAYTGVTHCIRGHEFTPENTWLHVPSNKRACKTCNTLRSRAKSLGLPFPKPPTPKNPKREANHAR